MTTSRLTHWGVKGLLARIYLYKGDLQNAQTYALSVINSNKFPLFTATAPTTGCLIKNIYSHSTAASTYHWTIINRY